MNNFFKSIGLVALMVILTTALHAQGHFDWAA